MTQALTKVVTFDEFINWYPNTGVRYELHDGVVVEMPPPTGEHENIIGFLVGEIVMEYKRIGLSYSIPKTAFVKPPETESVYSPDVLLLNRAQLIQEPLWKKRINSSARDIGFLTHRSCQYELAR
jgi:Uma2 family endonuclease